MKRKKNKGRARPNKRPIPIAEYANIDPIPEADLTLEKMSTYSSKKLLVTAMALNKKSKKEKNSERRDAMIKIASFIAQLLQGRQNIANQQVG